MVQVILYLHKKEIVVLMKSQHQLGGGGEGWITGFLYLCYVMLCCVYMICYVMLCYVMSCYVMLCYVMLCYVMLCYGLTFK